jgi:hypothetical protein
MTSSEIGTFPQKINIQLIELSRIIIINSDLQLQLLEYITHYNDSEMLALFFSKSGKSFYKGAALYFNLQLLEYITRYNNNEMLALFFNKHGKDFYEGKALEFAVENNQIDIARTLLEENNVTITSWSMEIVLKYAAENDDIDLLDLALPKCKDDINLGPALRTAAEKNHVQIMRKLLLERPGNHFGNWSMGIVLKYAAENDDIDLLDLVLPKCKDDINLGPALRTAAEKNHVQIMRKLLLERPDNHFDNWDIEGVLDYAVENDDIDLLDLALPKCKDDINLGTVLGTATEKNHVQIMRKLLLERPGNHFDNWDIEGVLDYAAENDDIDLLDLALHKCEDDIYLGTALGTAAEKNHVQIMRKLLEKSNIIPSYVKNTIVSDAINNDHSTVLEVIIEQYGEELEEYNIRYAVTYALENDNGSIITALSKHSSKLTSKERLNIFLAAARLGLDAAFTTLLHQHAHEFTRQAKQGALIKTAQHDHQALTEMLYASMGIDEQKQTLEEMIRQRQVAAVNLILKYQRSVFCSTLLKREINADENQNVLMNPMPDIELPRALADLIQGMTTIPPSSSHEELCSEYAKHLTILAKTGCLSADNMGTDIYSTVAEHSSFMISSGFIDQSDLTEEDTSTNPTGSRTTFSHDQLNIDDTVPKNIYNPYMIIGATSLVGWSSFGIAISIMQNISFIKALLCYTASIALGISFLTGTAIAYSFDNTTLAESMTGPHLTL